MYTSNYEAGPHALEHPAKLDKKMFDEFDMSSFCLE